MRHRSIARALAVTAALTVATSACVSGAPDAPPRWHHDTPPPVGTVLVARFGLFRCASVAGARYSAETGFLATDCTAIETADRWRVVACHEDGVSHGGLRLLEVLAEDGRGGWVPLPWHDWV